MQQKHTRTRTRIRRSPHPQPTALGFDLPPRCAPTAAPLRPTASPLAAQASKLLFTSGAVCKTHRHGGRHHQSGGTSNHRHLLRGLQRSHGLNHGAVDRGRARDSAGSNRALSDHLCRGGGFGRVGSGGGVCVTRNENKNNRNRMDETGNLIELRSKGEGRESSVTPTHTCPTQKITKQKISHTPPPVQIKTRSPALRAKHFNRY